MRRPRSTLTPLLASALVLALLAGACGSAEGADDRASIDGAQPIAALEPVSSCDSFLDQVRREALERVGPYGFGDGGPITFDDMPGAEIASADAAANGASAAPAPGDARPATPTTATPEDVSGTNVQEAGVDEPDIVKADGERLLVVAGGKLRWIDVTGDGPVEAGSVDLPGGYGQQLLVAGDRALVLTSGYGHPLPIEGDVAVGSTSMPVEATATAIAQVDISSPDAMAVIDTLEVEGSILDARLVGDTARVVVTAAPEQLTFVYPSSSDPEAEAFAEETNRRIIEESEVEDWLPAYRRVTDPAGSDEAVLDEGTLVECERLSIPAEFSGFGTLAVLTFDVPGELGLGDATGILADGEHVYASTDHLYVATTSYPEVDDATTDTTGSDITRGVPAPTPAATTSIHRFSTAGDGPAAYEVSGAVRGRLLDQFSMSEATEPQDLLRVATTDDGTQESYVTTLSDDGDALTEVGQVGGLGEGEQIYSVRFIGDMGYVVTFRQTDPLYTVDLRDPAEPAVVGELELLGYSAYLHPLGGDLLLGIGQDATATGQTTGSQLSLFDVSDPANPERLQQASIPGASSAAEYDHHAFLHWPETGLAVLPIQSYGRDCIGPAEAIVPCPGGEFAPGPFNGAIGFRVATGGIDEVGRVTHDDGSALTRSVVVGDTVYTLSETSLVASELADLAPRAMLALS